MRIFFHSDGLASTDAPLAMTTQSLVHIEVNLCIVCVYVLLGRYASLVGSRYGRNCTYDSVSIDGGSVR